eukprot:scaffold317_cov210-Alexandrium_tamarense.AAC.5
MRNGARIDRGEQGQWRLTGHVPPAQSHSLAVLLERSERGVKEPIQMILHKKEQQAEVTQVLLPSRSSNICTTTTGLVKEASTRCIAVVE